MKKKVIALIAVAALSVSALTGCGSKAQPANTKSLVFSHHYQLDYAQQFTADCYEGGYTMLTLTESGQQFLVTPEDAAEVEGLPESVTVLRQPIRNIYLVSTSVMDLFLALDGLDSVTLSGTRAEGWYLDEARAAMEDGRIAYAGKYSAPDYEKILAANCGLAIENTMIYHTPEVKEQLEKFGVPVLVERSSYESDPLARMEWVKLYGILLGRTEEAERVFDDAVQRIAPLLDEEPTGKTAAFFSITSNNLATVRKGGDYVAKMIGLAGGSYVFADLTDSGLRVYSTYGSEDGVLNREKYEADRTNLPQDTTETVIDGGCHAGFGSYSAQKGDGTPTISAEEQQRQTADALAAWMNLQ